MPWDRDIDEKDWEYLERKLPWLYEALHRIEDFREAKLELFDNGTFFWEGDDKVDLTNKVALGLLQLEIEGLEEGIKDIQDRLERTENREEKWSIFGREKDKVIFENNAQELHRVPVNLLDIIVKRKSFDGEIRSDGRFARYIMDGKTLCRIPKGLVRSLITKEKSEKSSEDEGGGG